MISRYPSGCYSKRQTSSCNHLVSPAFLVDAKQPNIGTALKICQGTTVHLPITRIDFVYQSSNKTDKSRVHYGVRRHVVWFSHCHNQRSTAWGKHLNLPVTLCETSSISLFAANLSSDANRYNIATRCARNQVLGYCVFPLTVSALLIAILRFTWFGTLWLDLIWLALGLLWATRVSSIFIGQFVKRERRLLALYPVFFFYLLLGWLILLF